MLIVLSNTVGMVLLAVMVAVGLVTMVVRILRVDLVVMVTVAVVTIVEGCAVIAVSNSVRNFFSKVDQPF